MFALGNGLAFSRFEQRCAAADFARPRPAGSLGRSLANVGDKV